MIGSSTPGASDAVEASGRLTVVPSTGRSTAHGERVDRSTPARGVRNP